MKKLIRGFTLIELLIVIAILGILAVALLLTINPGEAQKKSRDVKRAADLKTLQTILDQMISDGVSISGCLITAAGCSSTSAGTQAGSQPCSANWLQMDVCQYANTVPTDPNNNTTRSVITSKSGPGTPVFSNVTVSYEAKISGSDYEINVRQESASNATKVFNDGGLDNGHLEAGTKLDLISP